MLLHGILCSDLTWRNVVPLLADDYDVLALTMLGHRGGAMPARRPIDTGDIADDVERQLDKLGIDKAHLAGNSLGGLIALELARRGRALSVCGLSPALAWPSPEEKKRVTTLFRTAVKRMRRARRLLPLFVRFARFRRWALRLAAVHGDRVTPAEFVDGADDAIHCVIQEDLYESTEEFAPIAPAPCPISIAWSGEDRIFPLTLHGVNVDELVPQATFSVLEGVGHTPMYDDPRLTAETIRATAARAANDDE